MSIEEYKEKSDLFTNEEIHKIFLDVIQRPSEPPITNFDELTEDEIELISQKVIIDPNGFLESIFTNRGNKYFAVGRANQEKL